MPLKRYRVIAKVLCPSCSQAKRDGHIVKDCTSCTFLKYNNVTRLRKFTDFLDTKYPDWVWFKVYNYVKHEDTGGDLLATFKNWYKTYIRDGKKWIPTGTTRDVPASDQL